MVYRGERSQRRIAQIESFMKTAFYVGACRSVPEAFTRTRKIPLNSLVGSILTRKKKSLKLDILDFRDSKLMEDVSAPAYLKQRSRLNPDAIRLICDKFVGDLYAEEDMKTYKGHLLLSIDGSTINVPTRFDSLAFFGDSSNHGRSQASAGLSCLYDSLNWVIIDTEIDRYGFDERAKVKGHVEHAKELIGQWPFILLLDRGYTSLELLLQLSKSKVPFVMRVKNDSYTHEFTKAKDPETNGMVALEFRKGRLANLQKRNPSLYENIDDYKETYLRFVEVDIGNECPERLITNLESDFASTDELKEIYHERWGIETVFRFLKSKLQLENITSSKPVLIMQDIYASVFVANLTFDLVECAKEEADLKGYKHEMGINKSFAMGALMRKVTDMVIASESERKEILDQLVADIRRQIEPIRKNRSSPRVKTKIARTHKFSTSYKPLF